MFVFLRDFTSGFTNNISHLQAISILGYTGHRLALGCFYVCIFSSNPSNEYHTENPNVFT